MTQLKKEKTSREATERNYEIYNRINLLEVSDPMDESQAQWALADLYGAHEYWLYNPGNTLKKGFPFAIRKVGNKGYRAGTKQSDCWETFWRANNIKFALKRNTLSEDEVAAIEELSYISGVFDDAVS